MNPGRTHMLRRTSAAFLTTVTATTLASAIVPAGPAAASTPAPLACPVEETYDPTSISKGWFATAASSAWLAGPGSISYAETEGASFSGTFSVGWTFSASAVWASVSTEYNVSLTASTTYSKQWTYTKTVPDGKTARAVVHKRGAKYTFNKHRINTNCSTSSSYNGSGSHPYRANSLSEYCIALDTFPATDFQATTGGCTDH